MKYKYDIIKYNKKISKDYTSVTPLEVARFEYGDYDCWVDAIIIKVYLEKSKHSNDINGVIVFEDITGKRNIAYTSTYNGTFKLDIIGYAKERQTNKEDDCKQ